MFPATRTITVGVIAVADSVCFKDFGAIILAPPGVRRHLRGLGRHFHGEVESCPPGRQQDASHEPKAARHEAREQDVYPVEHRFTRMMAPIPMPAMTIQPMADSAALRMKWVVFIPPPPPQHVYTAHHRNGSSDTGGTTGTLRRVPLSNSRRVGVWDT